MFLWNTARLAFSKDGFVALLDQITREEYKDFIFRYASVDRDFKTKFELAISDGSNMDVEKKYGELIRKIIRRHSDRGFLDYGASIRVSGETGELIRDGRKTIADHMRKVMRDIPEEKNRIRELVRTLTAKNPRRPAMPDELKRILNEG
ncbi:MAG: hypothetical protein LBP50_05100 [Tannerella sp.]|nr:hypothetical protein [Tannerella sp.]